MSFHKRTNNKILPSNSRSVDVAKAEIANLIEVEQRRYTNAFEVQGFESIVYTRLRQGVPCSCQAHSTQLAGLLGEDGKMPEGKINELLTGGLEFEVTPYGSRTPVRPDLVVPMNAPVPSRGNQIFAGLDNPGGAIQPTFEIMDTDLSSPFVDVVVDATTTNNIGTNGPVSTTKLDDMIGAFDSNEFGFDDVKCGICFGTGYVGGYAVLGGFRQILDSTWPNIEMDGTLEANHRPHYFRNRTASFQMVLPKGFVGLDSFRVYNNVKPLSNYSLLIDGLTVSYTTLYQMCDGQPHTITLTWPQVTEWTHIEIQFNLMKKPFRIEFPKLQQSADITKIDQTDDVSISAPPNIPTLNSKDVVVESTFGKAFIITTSNWWNDNARNILGWDCSARVVQPNEILNLLPRRNVQKQKSTNMVRDNGRGDHRT